MIGAIFPQHPPAIRNNYAGGTPAPAGPPVAGTPAPIAPGLLPTFIVTATPSITRYNGQPADEVVLATIATTEASFSIDGEMPGGLAPSVTAGPVVGGLNTFTVAWPASGTYVKPFGLYRAALAYLQSSGSGGVLGGSLHEVLVLDPAILLTFATRVDLTGRIRSPISTSLATLTLAANADVTASIVGAVPGLSFSLAWTPGVTSSGTLSATGTPTTEGTYSVVATYSALGVVLGSSTHSVLIGAAYTPPAPAPAPVPAPAPLPPAPAPAAPAPVLPPAPASDSLLAQNRVRHHFHTGTVVETNSPEPDTYYSFGATAGQTSFVLPVTLLGGDSITIISVDGQGTFDEGPMSFSAYTTGSTVTIFGVFRSEMVYCYYNVNRAGTSAYDELGNRFVGRGCRAEGSGAAGGALYLNEGGSLSASVSGCDGAGAGLAAEIMVNMDDATWDAHRAAAGGTNRYTPVLTLLKFTGELAWTFGFFSTSGVRYSAGDTRRVVMAAGFTGLTSGGANFMQGAFMESRPVGFLHIAIGTNIAAGVTTQKVWSGGSLGITVTGAEAQIKAANPGRVQIAGACPIPALALFGSTGASLLKLAGTVDELRITAASRYASYYATPIPEASRQVPWPDY